MAEETVFAIGVDAICTDGVCGEVIRVVVDPVARAVTHLVVEPKHRQGLGRLVPLDLVDDSAGEVRLLCTVHEFEQLTHAEETQFLADLGVYGGYGAGDVLLWPYYDISAVDGPVAVTFDTVPLGEVAVRRGEHVHATDGAIGRAQGLVIDPGSRHVTHVLLQEGHLWGRKQVAIPISAVSEISDDGIRLSISKQEVEDLTPVDLDRHPNE
jgi:sporulation protein YlmC with PRC-barrel domain